MSDELEYCYSFSEDQDFAGSFVSREEAIAEAIDSGEYDPVDNNCIYTGVIQRIEPSQFFPNADMIINEMACQADSDAGEFDTNFPDASKEAEEDLDRMLNKTLESWCAKHGISVDFWHVNSIEEAANPKGKQS
ncbi:MAG: hypothetical protein ACPG47_02070 [Leucothrix sp.]